MTFWLVAIFTCLTLVTSILPYIPLAHGIFRVWEFPRTQNLFVSLITLSVAIVAIPQHEYIGWIFGALAAAILIQLFHIARFTPFWRRRSAEYKGEPKNAPQIKLLIFNVKMSNRDFGATVSMIEKHDPDIAIFMETDEQWIEALKPETEGYAHRIECPIDNGYGMMVVSKMRFFDDKIRYLLNPEVPSFDTMVEHENGDRFRLFVVHPEPPLATRDTMGRDAEIAFVGKLVRYDDQPVIVTGDLNDVAWSRTTRRFLRISRLLDPREGRGQYNTFDARFFFLRWPLDHIFHSPHFQLVSMARLPHAQSDHFPMLYNLALTEKTVARRRVDAASSEDLEEASELISVEKERDLRPIGHDWETS